MTTEPLHDRATGPDPAPAAQDTPPAETDTPAARTDGGTAAARPAAVRSTRRGYGARWADLPREFGFLILGFPIAITGFAVLVSLVSAGFGLLAVLVGVLLLVGALWTARGFAAVEIARLGWARQHVTPPRWDRQGPMTGWRVLLGPFTDGHYWLALLHGLVVNPIVSLVSWTLTVVWVSIALGGLTSWIWQWAVADGDDFSITEWILEGTYLGDADALGIDPLVGDIVLQVILGLVFLLTLPWVLHGLTLLHAAIARGMLGAWRSEALAQEVAQLSASRGAAVQAEDQSLRRLERDIHDGPQQRLVRLQMDLAAIERKLDADPEAARALLGEARDQARDTLDELRALSRGFAPPILQDRGLRVALDSLAARSPVPVVVEYGVTLGPLPAALERNAYFIAAELLTNSVKHAGATQIRLRVTDRDTGQTGRWLDLWVTDDGRGGAAAVPGHGLAGLEERVRGLGGLLVVDSPAGGPTIVGAHFPAGAATAAPEAFVTA